MGSDVLAIWKGVLLWLLKPGGSLHLGYLQVEQAPPLAVLAILAFGLWSLRWIHRDAERRGKSGVGAFFFAVLAGWPLSLLWWRWLRPPLLEARRLRLLGLDEPGDRTAPEPAREA